MVRGFIMKPEVVIIVGPNRSGKSTYTEYIVGPNQFTANIVL